jgi:large subunit ribosomal protein L23
MKLTSFDCIKKVLITSKSKKLAQNFGQIVLEIDPRANKSMIKKAAEELWENVKVKKVATMTVPGRSKRLKKGLVVVVGGYKKAIVTVSNAAALGMDAGSRDEEQK